MSRARLNTFLLGLFVVLVVLNLLGPANFSRHNFEYTPDMAHSPRYNSFSPNPNFPDGKTLQQPVPCTIPVGYHPYFYQATPEDALRAGREPRNPFSSGDAPALQRGATVFGNFCRPCHGTRATGDGPVAFHGFPAPPSLLADHAVEMPDGQMFHVVTTGQKSMPSYRAQISPEDRWRAILYVRSLQSKQSRSAEPPPPLTAQTPPKAGVSIGKQP